MAEVGRPPLFILEFQGILQFCYDSTQQATWSVLVDW